MIHLVFQYLDIAALQKSFELDPSIQGDIIEIADDFAVGPINNLSTEEGWQNRKQWWREVLAGGDLDGKVDDGSVKDDLKTVETLLERLRQNPDEVLWIWAAQNKHDVSGYYWLISQLKDFQGRIFILYLNNLPFINAKGNLFYPVNLSEIPAKEFVKAKKLARLVTASEFEIDPDEWLKLGSENKNIRILEGGKKLAQYNEDFYDKELSKMITGDWIKGHKLIGQFLSKATHTTGDAYLLWRLKKLIAAGGYNVQGALRGMREFEVRRESVES